MNARILAVASASLLCCPALAQENVTGNLPQGGTRNSRTDPVVAQVGAGTTDGTTNGISGPGQEAGGDGPPPLPDASLCREWQGTDAYAFCMEKTVGR